MQGKEVFFLFGWGGFLVFFFFFFFFLNKITLTFFFFFLGFLFCLASWRNNMERISLVRWRLGLVRMFDWIRCRMLRSLLRRHLLDDI